MKLSKDYFKNIFGRLDIKQNSNSCRINIGYERLGARIDRAQDALDAQVWNDIKTYMPHETGALIEKTNALNASTRGEVYLYPPNSDYGHYQYEGWKYVDPVYGVGAFYSETPEPHFWSRPGVKKIKSDVPLFYSKPKAEAHWDEAAYRDHGKEWVKVAKRAARG